MMLHNWTIRMNPEFVVQNTFEDSVAMQMRATLLPYKKPLVKPVSLPGICFIIF